MIDTPAFRPPLFGVIPPEVVVEAATIRLTLVTEEVFPAEEKIFPDVGVCCVPDSLTRFVINPDVKIFPDFVLTAVVPMDADARVALDIAEGAGDLPPRGVGAVAVMCL